MVHNHQQSVNCKNVKQNVIPVYILFKLRIKGYLFIVYCVYCSSIFSENATSSPLKSKCIPCLLSGLNGSTEMEMPRVRSNLFKTFITPSHPIIRDCRAVFPRCHGISGREDRIGLLYYCAFLTSHDIGTSHVWFISCRTV